MGSPRPSRLAALRNVPFVIRLMIASGRRHFAGLVATRIVVALVPVAVLAVAKLVLDAVVVSRAEHQITPAILSLILAEFALVALGAFAIRLMSFFDALCADRFELHVSRQILEHAARLDQASYEDPVFYDQLARARAQATDRFVMIKALGDFAQNLVLALSLVIGLAAFSPWYVALLVACTTPIFFINGVFSLRWYSLRLSQTPDRRRLDYLRQLGSSRESAKEVRLFGIGPLILQRYTDLARSLYDQVLRLQLRKLMFEALILLGTAGHYAIYGLIVYRAAQGEFSLGTMTFLIGAVAGASRAVQEVFVASTSVADQALFLNDLREFLAVQPTLVSPPRPRPVPRPIRLGFEFHDVSFVYPGTTRKVLDRVSFALRPGQTVALVGENGQGKTTIVKLLLRFHDPTEGHITLDGVDLRDYDLADLHGQTGAIFQDFVRYESTFRDNVVLGAGQEVANDLAIATALRWSRADEVLERLPAGMHQMLGRRFAEGVDMSGGEWQRVALARAYLRASQILILDEPSAALDAKAERELFERFSELVRGRIALLISHRFSTVKSGDRILVLSGGSIVEAGTHGELMTHRGLYHQLYTLQATSYQDAPSATGDSA